MQRRASAALNAPSEPLEPIKFGTDGWRAVIGRDYTFANVARCAQGVATYLKRSGLHGRELVVGYDTRFASEEFAAEVAQVVAANGINVLLCQPAAPTPVISYTVVHRKAAGGVIITASHNPSRWNGFKFRTDYGGSAPPEVINSLEEIINGASSSAAIPRLPLDQARAKGLLEEYDPRPAYMAHVEELVPLDSVRQASIKVVVDAMYGAGAGYLPRMLKGETAALSEIHGERNPLFPGISQPEPIAHNLEELSRRVVGSKAQVGLALDGDADRLGVIDEGGEFLTTLQTFALLCLYWLGVRGERGSLVRSITMTAMIDKLGKLYGVPVFVTPVGFKYLGPVFQREGALAAGEESGGYAFRGSIPERDGIMSGLMFLDLMAKTGKSPRTLVEWLYDMVGYHYYNRQDVAFHSSRRQVIEERVAQARPERMAGLKVREIDSRDGCYYLLEGGFWALVRFSGTEPVLRMYAEAESPSQVEELLAELRGIAGV